MPLLLSRLLGGPRFWTAWILVGAGARPSEETMCPGNSTECYASVHLDGLSFRLASQMHCRTSCRRSRCSSQVLPKTLMLSRYTRQVSHMRPERTASIRQMNVAGALQKLKWRTVNSYRCLPLVEKAVFTWWRGCTETCQYPDWRLRVENHLASRRALRESSIRRRGVASLIVASFRR